VSLTIGPQAIFYEKQAEKREDLMELVDMGA
jgi:hypothetical protein